MKRRENEAEIRVLPGNPRILGVYRAKNGYNFASVIPDEKEASLLLYEKNSGRLIQEIPLPPKERTGEVAAVFIEQFRPREMEYNYKIDGEIRQDPRAALLTGREVFGAAVDHKNPHSLRCGVLEGKFLWEKEERPAISLSEMILYKLHVRGYTSHKNSKVRQKGTFQGVEKKIPYLKELGITSVELMPCYEFDEIMVKDGIPAAYAYEHKDAAKVNCWGYTDKAFYFAPKASYCATGRPAREFMEMVRAFHQAGIECIMEFYFTGEISSLEVLDILRYWKTVYHIDGFHLVGDTRAQDYITEDPLLADTKLFFAGVDAQKLYKNKTPHFRRLAEYNEWSRQVFRRFLKGDEDMLGAFTYCTRRNPDTHGVVNYMSIQDGFTMADAVAYDIKHNEENGEKNRDGMNYNYSWNCGIEGPTRRQSIKTLRKQQIKNSFLFLLLSQGIPLIYQGDEIGNSQNGNNNAYCQDNEEGWVDWSGLRRNGELLEFVKKSIAFRVSHPVLHMPGELRCMDYKSYGSPDVSYHSQKAWFAELDNNFRHVGVMYNGKYAEDSAGVSDTWIYIAYNMHWLEHEFALPHLPGNGKWRVAIDTGKNENAGFYEEMEEPPVKDQKGIKVSPRTIIVLVGK